VSSLAATAWRVFADHGVVTACGVWLDAARGDVFAAAFARPAAGASDWPLVELLSPEVATPDAVLREARAALPAGAPIVLGPGARGREVLDDHGCRVLESPSPLAVAVGRIARRIHAAGGAGPPEALTPLYVRRPDAEVERDRRLGVPTPDR
jgi:tRNA A37 threonylcarbamoyladenosine modification protein TsaB